MTFLQMLSLQSLLLPSAIIKFVRYYHYTQPTATSNKSKMSQAHSKDSDCYAGLSPANQEAVNSSSSNLQFTKSTKGDQMLLINNTNVLKTGLSGSSDHDRHCIRPASKTGTMKCDACFDYNNGVALGSCHQCNNTNRVLR